MGLVGYHLGFDQLVQRLLSQVHSAQHCGGIGAIDLLEGLAKAVGFLVEVSGEDTLSVNGRDRMNAGEEPVTDSPEAKDRGEGIEEYLAPGGAALAAQLLKHVRSSYLSAISNRNWP